MLQIYRINLVLNGYDLTGSPKYSFTKEKTNFSRNLIPFYNFNTYAKSSLYPKTITLIDFNSLISVNLQTGTVQASSNCDTYLSPLQSRTKVSVNRFFYDNQFQIMMGTDRVAQHFSFSPKTNEFYYYKVDNDFTMLFI